MTQASTACDRDRARGRSEPRVERRRGRREDAVLRHREIGARRNHLDGGQAAQHADDDDRGHQGAAAGSDDRVADLGDDRLPLRRRDRPGRDT